MKVRKLAKRNLDRHMMVVVLLTRMIDKEFASVMRRTPPPVMTLAEAMAEGWL